MDALSELLRVVKLNGAMFFHAQCGVTWGVCSPPSQTFKRHVGAPCSHIIEFHLLSEGRGYVRVGEESMPLSAGDVIMMPHGDAHYLGSGPGHESTVADEDMRALLTGQLTLSRLGGSGEGARLICGYLASEAGLIQPLLDGLPRVVRVNIRSDAQGTILESMIRHAVDQASRGRRSPSSVTIRDRHHSASLMNSHLTGERERKNGRVQPTAEVGRHVDRVSPPRGTPRIRDHNDVGRTVVPDNSPALKTLSTPALFWCFGRQLSTCSYFDNNRPAGPCGASRWTTSCATCLG